MYLIFKNVIKTGNYELADMLKKIDTKWAENAMNDDERNELVEMAREKAVAENSYANADKRFENLYEEIAILKQRVKDLETKANNESGEVVEPEIPMDEYPEFVQPTGAHDAYYTGSKTSENGQKYICIAPEGVPVVWPPSVMPSYWELVE